ncbi:MAG: murein L,D-transpeptidase [Sedimentitalea sp.]
MKPPFRLLPTLAFVGATFAFSLGASAPVSAQVTAFKQAVAEAASVDDSMAAYYRAANYQPLWTGTDDVHRARRAALIEALRGAKTHGLPQLRYDVASLMAQMKQARTTRDLGLIEVALSKAYLRYARDVQSGALVPSKIDAGLVRKVEYRDQTQHLAGLERANPRAFIAGLAPGTQEYRALRKEKMRLELLVAQGGWGEKISAKALKPGQTGEAVVALRNRLIAMGYMHRSAAGSYDATLQKAVQAFQEAHGLEADGVAGAGTVTEMNRPAEDRLKSVLVAMERERWLNKDRGKRHVLVNLADFHAQIIDEGRVTFKTRSVIGKNVPDRRSPEFSDVMEHMIINPSWHVPRSIMTKEYLPQLKRNPNAAGHLIITDRRGRRVDRSAVDFTQFSRGNFPFDMRQPPSNRNALGLVKFMFPNKYNIYLHDTPQKALFSRESRAYSHGCIRLADPFDFAYALLAVQNDDPKPYFQGILKSRRETKVVLDSPVPVHLIYRTAFTSEKGRAEYRRDVYGRDAKIWNALQQAGVVLRDVQG